jgi:hypothetical protein
MAGQLNGVYSKLGTGNRKGSMVGPGGIWRQRERASPGVLKPILTYGKENQVIPIQQSISGAGQGHPLPGVGGP